MPGGGTRHVAAQTIPDGCLSWFVQGHFRSVLVFTQVVGKPGEAAQIAPSTRYDDLGRSRTDAKHRLDPPRRSRAKQLGGYFGQQYGYDVLDRARFTLSESPASWPRGQFRSQRRLSRGDPRHRPCPWRSAACGVNGPLDRPASHRAPRGELSSRTSSHDTGRHRLPAARVGRRSRWSAGASARRPGPARGSAWCRCRWKRAVASGSVRENGHARSHTQRRRAQGCLWPATTATTTVKTATSPRRWTTVTRVVRPRPQRPAYSFLVVDVMLDVDPTPGTQTLPTHLTRTPSPRPGSTRPAPDGSSDPPSTIPNNPARRTAGL